MFVLLSLLACRKVEPAPEDLDSLAHYFWQNYDEPDAAIPAAAVVNLHAALDADKLDEVREGTITDLSADELAIVGKEDEDPAAPAGIFYAGVIGCPLADVEESVYALDQDVLHEGVYDSYEREYTSDFDAYVAREEEFLTWDSHYAVSGFGYEYEATIHGGLRYVPEIDEESSPHGPAMLSRGVLEAPAYFGDDDDRGMFQDYQLEVYYERAAGETVHLYVIWREMVLFGSTDFDSDSAQRLVLEGLADWDEEIEARCGG